MKNIPVMIVDDEKLVMEDLTTIVDWKNLGFEIVATAYNGKQALNKFQQYRPKLVITDIKMPFMDGIELIKRLRELDGQVQILLLTAYEDFTYAKSAIQYGITDYIIKGTISRQSVTELLHRLREIIGSQGEVLDMLREKQMEEFFQSDIEFWQCRDTGLFTKPYCYFFAEQHMPVDVAGDNTVEVLRCSKKEMIAVMAGMEWEGCEQIACSGIGNERVLLVLQVKESSEHGLYQRMQQWGGQLREKLTKQLRMPFTIYAVDKSMRLEELKQWYLANGRLFYKKYFHENSGLFVMGKEERRRARQTDELTADTAVLSALLEAADSEGLLKFLEGLFAGLQAVNEYQCLLDASRKLYEVLKKYILQIPEHEVKSDISVAGNWRNWTDSSHLQSWFADCFLQLADTMEKKEENRYSRPIIKAMEYIGRHYPEHSLTIRQIAADANISAGHLCALFKKETGGTLNQYITHARVAEAKRLLEEGELKVYEIAEAVGYQTSQYFSQVFYKQVGSYPTDYQKGQ